MNKDHIVDGGKFCADCKGRCCKSCAYAVGYFYQELFVPDFKRFTLPELEAISAVHHFGPRHNEKNEKHPIHKLAAVFGVEFHPQHGFGGPTGCRLPREKRSRTCLRYFCHELAEHLGLEQTYGWSKMTEEEMQPGNNTPIDAYIIQMKAKTATVSASA